jgi:hypothetical protein
VIGFNFMCGLIGEERASGLGYPRTWRRASGWYRTQILNVRRHQTHIVDHRAKHSETGLSAPGQQGNFAMTADAQRFLIAVAGAAYDVDDTRLTLILNWRSLIKE